MKQFQLELASSTRGAILWMSYDEHHLVLCIYYYLL